MTPFSRRLALLVLALSGCVVLIAWIVHTTRLKVAALQQRYHLKELETIQIAQELQTRILEVTNDLLRSFLHLQPNDIEDFRKNCDKLNEWIRSKQPLFESAREQQVLREIMNRLKDYRRYSEDLLQERQKGQITPEQIRVIDTVQQKLLGADYQLMATQEHAFEARTAQSEAWLFMLEAFIYGALVGVLGASGWLALLVYREKIAPLQTRVVASEALLAQQEKLASLGLFAAGIAHEIRNPLTALKARLFSLQKHFHDDAKSAEIMRCIRNELDRLEGIVRSVLDFARPSEPKLAVVAPETLVLAAADLLRQSIEDRGIELKIEAFPKALVRVDPEQIQQVLINLIQNAADSIDGPGTITLRLRRVVDRLAFNRPCPCIMIEVEDTGRGIPPDVQKRMLDPFFTTKDKGTGLGLAIAARLVQQQGGHLQYRTELNHGSAFGVVLPEVP